MNSMSRAAGKRKRAETTPATNEESARLRMVIDETTDEFICPISCELPLDPVMAEDGKIYERRAIEDWLKDHDKSPVTNLPMGNRLTPALQVRNVIEKMVRSGVIEGSKAEAWQTKIKVEESCKELLRTAEGGDAKAMFIVALSHTYGYPGFAKDQAKALKWARRGAEAGSAKCMCLIAHQHLSGTGGAQKSAGAAIHWFTKSAKDGSPFAPACAVLGYAFAESSTLPLPLQCDRLQRDAALLQLPKDGKEATGWLRKAQARSKPDWKFKSAIDLWLASHAVE